MLTLCCCDYFSPFNLAPTPPLAEIFSTAALRGLCAILIPSTLYNHSLCVVESLCFLLEHGKNPHAVCEVVLSELGFHVEIILFHHKEWSCIIVWELQLAENWWRRLSIWLLRVCGGEVTEYFYNKDSCLLRPRGDCSILVEDRWLQTIVRDSRFHQLRGGKVLLV